jgi:hypothetical protein
MILELRLELTINDLGGDFDLEFGFFCSAKEILGKQAHECSFKQTQ